MNECLSGNYVFYRIHLFYGNESKIINLNEKK